MFPDDLWKYDPWATGYCVCISHTTRSKNNTGILTPRRCSRLVLHAYQMNQTARTRKFVINTITPVTSEYNHKHQWPSTAPSNITCDTNTHSGKSHYYTKNTIRQYEHYNGLSNTTETQDYRDYQQSISVSNTSQLAANLIQLAAIPLLTPNVKPGRPTDATNGWTYFFGTTAADLPIAA